MQNPKEKNEKSEPKSSKPQDKAGEAASGKSEIFRPLRKFWQDPWNYTKRFEILLPYVLPSTDVGTWVRYAGVLACGFMKRGLNLYTPMQLGNIVKTLEGHGTMWDVLNSIVVYIVLKFLNSGSGIAILENYLWRPIQDDTAMRLNIASYQHVMSLSSDYHDNKKTAAVWEGARSGWAVLRLVSLFSFDLIPRFFDVILSMTILWTKYDANTAKVAVVTMIAYNYIAIRNQTRRRDRIRRNANTRGEEANILMETTTNWSTVACFNRFDYEFKRYEDAVHKTQKSQIDEGATARIWGSVQQVITLLGLGSACFSVAEEVRRGEKSAAEFMVFVSYWTQLIGPLTSFVGLFMMVGQTLVSTEKLLELFETQPSIKDAEDAKDIEVTEGMIEFENVKFGYKEEREILKDVSFKCVPGSITAIVGETGGGKSTILKLISRFYDAGSGRVTIDQQDVKHVKLGSLRNLFGHVPQNIGVFNASLLENLRYGKLDATLEECQEACKAAALHERILEFPDGYETTVGEKGVKLSGGELQRLAIARVVLRNPKILLLDEATSSVDTATEAMIQESLKRVASGRTTVVVAHRLSTIAHADLILVVKDGQIIEQGNHQALLAKQGTYHGLWTRQEIKAAPSTARILQRAKSYPLLVREMDRKSGT